MCSLRKFRFLFVVFISLLMLSSCSIEKRRYSGGYHVHIYKNNYDRVDNVSASIHDNKTELSAAEQTPPTENPAMISASQSDETIKVKEDYPLKIVHRNTQSDTEKVTLTALQEYDSYTATVNSNPQKVSAEVHPHAFTGFLCGIASAGSLITMFLFSFNPAALMAVLLVSVIVFALLAMKLSRSAFSDMHYARHRYGGRGLASAAMVLGVVSLVALIGFIVVLGISVVFAAFA